MRQTTPTAQTRTPIVALIRPALASAGVPASRSAAIGEIFPARRAGM